MNLEEEFQKLMDVAVQQIEEKRARGDLSRTEADDLIDMIAKRRNPPIHDQEPEGGWEQSSWCGDTAWESSEKCW